MTDLVQLLRRTEWLERLLLEVSFRTSATLPEDIDVEWSGWDVVKPEYPAFRGQSFIAIRSTEARGIWFLATQPNPDQPFLVALASTRLISSLREATHVEPR